MKWSDLLKQNNNLATIQRLIKSDSSSWSSYDGVQDMTEFLNRILMHYRNKDVDFRRECIRFIIDVFHPSSISIRKCILLSPIMQGIYEELLSGGELSSKFEEIVSFADSIHEWRDLKSGISLLNKGYLSKDTIRSLSTHISERELTDLVMNQTISEDVIELLLCDRNNWEIWSNALIIIERYPKSLKYRCFQDAALIQSDEEIHELCSVKGIDKLLVRKIVLKKGKINDWEFALDYLGQDILISGDDVFQRIAVSQDCKELFNLYEGEYIEKEDLKKIIQMKGFWADLESIDLLHNDNILNIPKEQLILSALNHDDGQAILNRICEDTGSLSKLNEQWCKTPSLCPDFPSLCWDTLLNNLTKDKLECANGKMDYLEVKDEIANLSDESRLKSFIIRLYSTKGKTYVYGLLAAIRHGDLVSQQFINDYKTITSAVSYLSLREIASFRENHIIDIGIIRAAKILGVLAFSSKHDILLSISEDLSYDDKQLGNIYNRKFFSLIEKTAESEMGDYYASYQSLNNEQKHAILTEEESSLVVSSAGSGKTRVIVRRYEYLTQVKHVDSHEIRILAYTRATKDEINKEKLGFKEEKEAPARTFHSFATEVIKLTGIDPRFIKDVQNKAGSEETDHSPRAAILFKLMSDDGIEQNAGFMNALSLYAVRYNSRKDKDQNLSFYTDRNGDIGCLKSYQEKVIFDFLADNNVDFAYERKSDDGKAKPDFTIFVNGKLQYYYEHFAVDKDWTFSPYGEKYLSDAMRKRDDIQWKDKLIYTTGAGIQDTDDILEQLKHQLVGVTLKPKSDEERTAILRQKENYHEIFQSGIKMCLDVYDIIHETRLSIEDACSRCSNDEYANTFMSVLFTTTCKYYEELMTIGSEERGRIVDYTGCIEYATELCNNGIISIKDIPWNYILIDEYQDISRLRLEFIKSLCKVKPQLKICAVGDDWQSIYSFANSDLSRFKGFENDWPFCRILKMNETFRFNNPLLSISTNFLKQGKDPLLVNKTVIASKLAPAITEIKTKQCTDFNHQINTIKKILREEKIRPKDCLILARYNSDLHTIRDKYFANDTYSVYKGCLMSMHKSKGLTRSYVFLVNCNSEVIPSIVEDDKVVRLIRHSNIGDKNYEERRLFYVAITRANKKTFVFYSGTPSVFVTELEDIIKKSQ